MIKKLPDNVYGVYHWDTFDNMTFLITTKPTLKEAENYVAEHYAGRISPHGADKVDIVHKGNIVRQYSVG